MFVYHSATSEVTIIGERGRPSALVDEAAAFGRSWRSCSASTIAATGWSLWVR
ncbi:hypothetical protein [Sinomonas sp. G460-2]|uniref:hypothetical protein n=1 Tax=Sinomonas sp. G460-2 TaxID=3393464 RepID=UPI0039F10B3C